MWWCQHCGASLREGFRFCPYCGGDQQSPAAQLPHKGRRPGPGQARCQSPWCGAIVRAGTLDRRKRCRACAQLAGACRARARARRYRVRRRLRGLGKRKDPPARAAACG